MAKYTAALVEQNSSAKICNVYKPRHADTFFVTILASGDFGGGTVTFQASVDGGTTKIDLNDALGNPATLTDDGNLNLMLGTPNANSDTLELYATIGSATDPEIDIFAFDNLG